MVDQQAILVHISFQHHCYKTQWMPRKGKAKCQRSLEIRVAHLHFLFRSDQVLVDKLGSRSLLKRNWFVQAWRQGNTGYPMVDASMRQLWSTGWLHNRSRVTCASFLVKNLLLPWQWGLKHYWDCLLDADLECAALGWQFCSGCLAGQFPSSPLWLFATSVFLLDLESNCHPGLH